MYDKSNSPDAEEYLQELRTLHDLLVEICALSLKEVKNVDLKDKQVLIRTIMRDMHDYSIAIDESEQHLAPEDFAVDMWVDKVEYIDDRAFYLYLTQAEPDIFWNIERKGEIPARIEDAKMRITVRCGMAGDAPFVPVAYLLVLALKLALQTFGELPGWETKWTEYLDEHKIIKLADVFASFLGVTHAEQTKKQKRTKAC